MPRRRTPNQAGPVRRPVHRSERRPALRLESLEDRTLLSTAIGPQETPRYWPGEVLVQFKNGTDPQIRERAHARLGAEIRDVVYTPLMHDRGEGPIERLILPAGRSVESAILALQKNPNVEFVGPNWIYTADGVANDPFYLGQGGDLWGLYGDNQVSPFPNFWGIGVDQAWAEGTTGSSEIVIGVIDTGIQITHPDLNDNIWINPGEIAGNGVDDDGNGYVDDLHGWDFFYGDNTVFDSSTYDDHGTHVAGTIGGEGNNGIGVAGVNWDVSIVSAKFLGPNGGSTFAAIQAVNYFVDLKVNRGINVVALNNSWGGGGYDQGLYNAISSANDAGILFIASAGNSRRNNDRFASYPANYNVPNVVSVAAINPDGTLASYSNYGSNTVHLAAPGTSILSTVPNGYARFNGTSMAAPHVTGTAALFASKYAAAYGATPTVSEIKSAILDTVDTSYYTYKTITGGRLDAYAALSTIPNGPVDQAPTIAITTPASGALLTGTSTLILAADATDDHGIQQVEFFLNGTSVGVDTNGDDGWSVAQNNLPDGSYTIIATATDTNDQTASDSVSVVLDNGAPIVSITAPISGTVSGTVTLRADAIDTASGVGYVTFYADGVGIGTDTDGGDGWSLPWNTTNLPNGSTVVLTATAWDRVGLWTTSDPLPVIVDNTAPAGITVSSLSYEGPATPGWTGPVTIQGAGFQAGATVSLSGGQGRAPILIGYLLINESTIQVQVEVPRQAKRQVWWNVTVTNPDGTSATLSGTNGFYVA